jgi:hypothetical protein
VLVGVLIVIAGWGFFAWAFHPRGVDLYKPTAAESRVASTTVPIPAAGCVAFAHVRRTTAIAADETAFGFLNPTATPAKATKALSALHTALTNAMRYAQGPMRQRLRNADLSAIAADFEIASWHGVVPKNVLLAPVPLAGDPSMKLAQMRENGYTELRVAERLLASTCGGRLAPPAERVLFPPTRVSTTTSQHHR